MTAIDNKLVEAYKEQLLQAFADADPRKVNLAGDLIDRAAFMAVELDTLENEINQTGAICEYDNGGGQKGKQIAPAMKQYNALVKTYANTVKILLGTIRKEDDKTGKSTALEDFCRIYDGEGDI